MASGRRPPPGSGGRRPQPGRWAVDRAAGTARRPGRPPRPGRWAAGDREAMSTVGRGRRRWRTRMRTSRLLTAFTFTAPEALGYSRPPLRGYRKGKPSLAYE